MSVVFGVAAMVIALAILVLVREHGTDRQAARAGGSSLDALRHVMADRDLRWVFLTSVLGGGGRGLGVVDRVQCDTEFAHADAPTIAGVLGINNVGPTIAAVGYGSTCGTMCMNCGNSPYVKPPPGPPWT